MIFAEGIGTTFTLGRYTVRIALRADNPAFAKYIVFKGDRLIGKQFSRPCEDDCRWLEHWGREYATTSRWHETSSSWHRRRGGHVSGHRQRGRPRKADAERELLEALAV